jgi:hypothetical protein
VGFALALAALVAGSPFAGSPVPSVVVDSFRAQARTPYGVESIAWEGPESLAVSGQDGDLVEVDGLLYSGASEFGSGSIERRRFPARPDGYSELHRLRSVTEFVLAQARGGTRRLTETALAGRPAFRTSAPLRANKCGGLEAGRVTIWLDRATLLPLRLVQERAGQPVQAWSYRYTELNAKLRQSLFAPPEVGEDPYRRDSGFIRTAPAHAAGPLSYTPSLPGALPEGFGLAVSGWARTSGITGPEGSNPPSRELFAAVYRRGWETIEVTQRLAAPQPWFSDPFGAECVFEHVEKATVGSATATYGLAPEIVPHLYWRRGRFLFTISGPFPKSDLVAIAASLRPLGS